MSNVAKPPNDLAAMMVETLFNIALTIQKGEVRAETTWTEARRIEEAGQAYDVVIETRVRPAGRAA